MGHHGWHFMVSPNPEANKQFFVRIVCPYCLTDKVRVLRTNTRLKLRYYECLECSVLESGRGTIFKVSERSFRAT